MAQTIIIDGLVFLSISHVNRESEREEKKSSSAEFVMVVELDYHK